jgi:hypothetical protein
MKLKIFDVVELNNGNKATIVENKTKDIYKAEIVTNEGKILGIKLINENDVNKIIFSRKN